MTCAMVLQIKTTIGPSVFACGILRSAADRHSYDGLRPMAQIQFFPDTCLVATSVNPA